MINSLDFDVIMKNFEFIFFRLIQDLFFENIKKKSTNLAERQNC